VSVSRINRGLDVRSLIGLLMLLGERPASLLDSIYLQSLKVSAPGLSEESPVWPWGGVSIFALEEQAQLPSAGNAFVTPQARQSTDVASCLNLARSAYWRALPSEREARSIATLRPMPSLTSTSEVTTFA